MVNVPPSTIFRVGGERWWYTHQMLTAPLDFQGNSVGVSGQPGLGAELNLEVIQAHLAKPQP